MAQGRLDVDSIINQMINSGGRNVKIREKDISLLCKLTREIFMDRWRAVDFSSRERIPRA